MPKLTLKSRFAVIFTLFVFLLLLILYTLFALAFNFFSAWQIRNDLSKETNEIINTHLLLEKNRLAFRKDETGSSLREHLINENFSAVFFTADKGIIRTYGSFAYGDKKRLSQELKTSLKTIITGKDVVEKDIAWSGLKIKAFSVALKNKNKLLGFMTIGKSQQEFVDIKNLLGNIFLLLGIIALIGSYLTGYTLSHHALNPLIALAKTVENIDIDKLDQSFPLHGHPQDEIVILAKKFNEMTIRLKEMVTRQKEFVANASHELKTPLTRAISAIELIELNPTLAKQELKIIKSDLFSINKLLDNLLFLTKLKKDLSLDGKSYQIDLKQLFGVITKHFKNKLSEKKISLIGNYPRSMNITLPQEYLQLILTNLISNSIKYSPPRKIINLTVSGTNQITIIKIKDQGLGMTQEEKTRIFERFFRSRDNLVEQGYGIGLSIVKKICDIYGVKLTVDSVKGIGTTVTLQIKN